jgi:hypothetical protein
MDDRLKNALDFSNYQQTLSVQRKTLREKMESKLTYGYNGGIFKIDRNLLTFVQILIDQERISGIPLLDINDNPILIEDLTKFRDEIFDRYFTVTYEYLESYGKIKSSRSIEKLTDL